MRPFDEQIRDTLDQISDESGEFELNGPTGQQYVLKYEGWSPTCIPVAYTASEQSMKDYGVRQSSKIHREWDNEMHKRGYRAVYHEHDEHLGLYGVTYALYRRPR